MQVSLPLSTPLFSQEKRGRSGGQRRPGGGKEKSRQFDVIGETDPSLSNTHEEREKNMTSCFGSS